MELRVQVLREGVEMPRYATSGAAAFDFKAAETTVFEPGALGKVALGLAFEIPDGYVMIVCMRSGIGAKTSLRQSNGIGVIDSDYRGEVSMLFDNTAPLTNIYSDEVETLDGINVSTDGLSDHHLGLPVGSYVIQKGDRIAQGFLMQLPQVDMVRVDSLSETDRGSGGFGHTGVS